MNISNGKFIHSSRANENTPTIVTKEHRPQKTMESKTVNNGIEECKIPWDKHCIST